MDGQKSHAKLTRTQSSLLRASPTVRSSIHSLSSINQDDYYPVSSSDEDQENPARKGKRKKTRSSQTVLNRFRPGLSLISMVFFTILVFFIFYRRKDKLPTSVNLLLALIFVAVMLFLASKNMGQVRRTVSVLKHSWFAQKTNQHNPPVRWFIGSESTPKRVPQNTKNSSSINNNNIEGVEVFSTGDVYEGEFHKGIANGSGVYGFFANGRYEGDWVDGKYDGYGVESWCKGSRYRGQHRQGMRHGFGIYRFYTGDSYAGEWCNGQSHGVGVQSCADGSCYVGEFKWGVKHGLGCYHFRNGDKYAGEYFNDKVHGFGVYHFAHGHCYEGSWHEGRKQGYGMYTFRSGDRKCGEWDSNTLKIHLPQLTDPVLKAVQAARRTSENAVNLRNVDEQVNKAVTAANRAATAARVAAVKAVQNQMHSRFCDIV